MITLADGSSFHAGVLESRLIKLAASSAPSGSGLGAGFLGSRLVQLAALPGGPDVLGAQRRILVAARARQLGRPEVLQLATKAPAPRWAI